MVSIQLHEAHSVQTLNVCITPNVKQANFKGHLQFFPGWHDAVVVSAVTLQIFSFLNRNRKGLVPLVFLLFCLKYMLLSTAPVHVHCCDLDLRLSPFFNCSLSDRDLVQCQTPEAAHAAAELHPSADGGLTTH